MDSKILHDVLIVVLGGIFGVALGKLPMWAFYVVLAAAIVLAIILLN